MYNCVIHLFYLIILLENLVLYTFIIHVHSTTQLTLFINQYRLYKQKLIFKKVTIVVHIKIPTIKISFYLTVLLISTRY